MKNQIHVITENQFYKKALEKEFPKAKIILKKDFQKEMLEKYSQLQDHIVLYHNEKYYEIIGEIEQELKIKYAPINMGWKNIK